MNLLLLSLLSLRLPLVPLPRLLLRGGRPGSGPGLGRPEPAAGTGMLVRVPPLPGLLVTPRRTRGLSRREERPESNGAESSPPGGGSGRDRSFRGQRGGGATPAGRVSGPVEARRRRGRFRLTSEPLGSRFVSPSFYVDFGAPGDRARGRGLVPVPEERWAGARSRGVESRRLGPAHTRAKRGG